MKPLSTANWQPESNHYTAARHVVISSLESYQTLLTTMMETCLLSLCNYQDTDWITAALVFDSWLRHKNCLFFVASTPALGPSQPPTK
jgi:hypothetical protein